MGTRSKTDEARLFTGSKQQRDARCVEKDKVTRRIVDALSLRKGSKAVVMPSMWGPETGWLHQRGMAWSDMFAIERNRLVHEVLMQRAKRKQGPPTTPMPLSAIDAIDHVGFTDAKLVYFDYFGQPDGTHLRTIAKAIRLGVIDAGTTLLVTFGINRGDNFSVGLNKRIKREHVGQAYVDAANDIASTGLRIRRMRTHAYVSLGHVANFSTTEVTFR